MTTEIKVCLDSRLIKPGEYFVPVKGESFDGHKFVDEVLKKGAAGVIEENELYEMAQEKLERLRPVIVGVAGSVGKSSARSYLTQILSKKHKVLEGDLNTKLGLATLIVNNLIDQRVIVAELGIDRLGEMKMVTDFIKPNFSMITKLEKEHLQFLVSIENVVNENLVAITNSRTKIGYVNKNDAELIKGKINEGSIIYYPAESVPKKILMAVEELVLPRHDKEYLVGVYQICKDKFNLRDEVFIQEIGNISKPKGRLNVIEGINGSVVVDDSYNAVADQSVIKGIEFAKELALNNSKKLVAIISPMRETGETEEEQHRNVAEYLNKQNNLELIVVGDEGDRYGKYLKGKYKKMPSSEEFEYKVTGEEIFYVKGSQFYRLEKVVYYLMKEKEKAAEKLVRQDARWK